MLVTTPKKTTVALAMAVLVAACSEPSVPPSIGASLTLRDARVSTDDARLTASWDVAVSKQEMGRRFEALLDQRAGAGKGTRPVDLDVDISQINLAAFGGSTVSYTVSATYSDSGALAFPATRAEAYVEIPGGILRTAAKGKLKVRSDNTAVNALSGGVMRSVMYEVFGIPIF